MFFGCLTIAINGFSMVFYFSTIAFNGFRWFRTIGQTMRWFRWIVVVYLIMSLFRSMHSSKQHHTGGHVFCPNYATSFVHVCFIQDQLLRSKSGGCSMPRLLCLTHTHRRGGSSTNTTTHRADHLQLQPARPIKLKGFQSCLSPPPTITMVTTKVGSPSYHTHTHHLITSHHG